MDWIISSISEIPGLYFCSALTSGYALYYLLEVVKKPIIACSEGEFKNFLTTNIPLLNEKFWPTVWCVESRLQTLMASFVRATSIPQVNYRREIFTLSDGGQVCLDWMDPVENCPADTPSIIILPGLTGASKADYVRGLVLAAKDEGLRAVVFNQRGIGGIQLKTPRTYCAANFEDLVEVIAHVRSTCANAPIAATGISMGGLILGNYISTHPDASKSLTAAMLISVPWNVFKGCDSIERPVVNLLLNRHLASCLCNIIRAVREVVEPTLGANNVDSILKSRTIKEFDSLYTCKQFGYDNVDAYYSAATIHNKVHRMKVPTLCLNAADDPFQPYDGIPVEEVNKSHNVCVVITPRGGHIGFMEGIWPLISIGRRQYMFELFAQFFRSALSRSSEDFIVATQKGCYHGANDQSRKYEPKCISSQKGAFSAFGNQFVKQTIGIGREFNIILIEIAERSKGRDPMPESHRAESEDVLPLFPPQVICPPIEEVSALMNFDVKEPNVTADENIA